MWRTCLLIQHALLALSFPQYLYSYPQITPMTKLPTTRASTRRASMTNPSDIIKEVGKNGAGEDWTYQNFLNNLSNNNIDQVSILSDEKAFAAIDKNHATDMIEKNNIHIIKTIPHMIDDLIPQLKSHGINFDIFNTPIERSGGLDLSTPLQFIGGYVVFTILFNILSNTLMNRANGENRGMNFMNRFTQMNPLDRQFDVMEANSTGVTFEDVAGCDEAKQELMEVVDFLKNPDKYNAAGAKIPRGILLEGQPGTGKTLLARAVAGEAGVSFISASGSEFVEMFVGVGASRVRKLFDSANANTPCVIFIDEIDAIGRRRGSGMNTGNDEREQTLNQILTNMDGFEETSEIIVLAATNRADVLDAALLRPGRFDRKVNVPLPDLNGRKEIFKVHLKNKKLSGKAPDALVDEIAILTTGFSGADLSNLANEAAILSARMNKETIDRATLLEAFEKVTIGIPSLTNVEDKEIVELVSHHEVGHALTVKYFEEFFDLRKVTINSNKNGAGGYTLFTPKERFTLYPTKKFLLANMVVALGGRAAEVVLYSKNERRETDAAFPNIQNLDITSGASGDLIQADRIARQYLSLFGVPEDGKYTKNEAKIDEKVSELINSSYEIAINLIEQNAQAISFLTGEIMKKRVLDASDFNNIKINIKIKFSNNQ